MSLEEYLMRTQRPAASKKGPSPAIHPIRNTKNGNLYDTIKPVIYIGIDPGISTGFATWFARKGTAPGRFLEVSTFTFWAAIQRLDMLTKEFGPAALRARIEDVRGNKPTFDKGQSGAAVREKISQNIGSNKRDCQLLIEYLSAKGIPYDALVPRKKETGTGKVGIELFTGIVGFPARCSQHGRDAAFLVVGL